MNRPSKAQVLRRAEAMAKVSTGTYSATGEHLSLPIYDSQELAPALSKHIYFLQGTGKTMTNGTTKTLADANFDNNAVPVNQSRTVFGIGLIYQFDEIRTPAEMQSIYDLLNESVLTLEVNGKDKIWQTSCAMTIGKTLSGIVESAAPNDVVDNSMDCLAKYYPFKVPQTLSALTDFKIILEHFVAVAAGLEGDKIKLFLDSSVIRLS